MKCCNPSVFPTVALANANPDIPTGIVLLEVRLDVLLKEQQRSLFAR